MANNSVAVDLTFATPYAARTFYFEAPGEGFCSGGFCHKCIEGDTKQAKQLERMARRAKNVVTISVENYSVEN